MSGIAMAACGASMAPVPVCSSRSSSYSFVVGGSSQNAGSGVSLASRRGDVLGVAVVPAAACGRRRRRSFGKGHRHLGVPVFAIDAAQEFDYECVKLTELSEKSKLKVGIVGFGNFGQFLAQRFVKQGHNVLAHSRSDYGDVAAKLGVAYFRDADDFCEEHPEVVVLCTSILSTEVVLRSFPVQRLKRNTLFVDVLSVKEFPRNLFLQVLPTDFDVLCTHPMFGPESGSGSWAGLPLVYDKVRVREGYRTERCRRFLNVFGSEGCRMVEMSCEEHDRHAAGSQFITHTVGRVLGSLGLESTPISTKGYESLLELVDNTYSDSFDLYYGLFLYNINATDEAASSDKSLVDAQLRRLEQAFDFVKAQLFDKLHGILRQQMLKSNASPDNGMPSPPKLLPLAPHAVTHSTPGPTFSKDP